MFFTPLAPKQAAGGFSGFGFGRFREDFAAKEGAVAVLRDASAPLGLLSTGGPWLGADRPSASNRVANLTVVHEQYAMLYRLATRAPPEEGSPRPRTRVEIEVSNKFIPGPLTIYNTIGEIRGPMKWLFSAPTLTLGTWGRGHWITALASPWSWRLPGN
jgi:hypothetical protein